MAIALDKYETPEPMAVALCALARRARVKLIADFCVGAGGLLKAASHRWKRAKLLATDICPTTVARLRVTNPDWLVSQVDFLNARSRAASKMLRKFRGKVDLALLNPPFSCRGAKGYPVKVDGKTTFCSLAMAFVLHAIDFLTANGQLAVVLPKGALSSERDEEAWSLIRKRCTVATLSTHNNNSFKDCRPHTCSVLISRVGTVKRRAKKSLTTQADGNASTVLHVKRGTLQMHDLPKLRRPKALALVHSTSLRKGAIATDLLVKTTRSITSGPAVLLPRVGVPSVAKIAVLKSGASVALSDCVYALNCRSHSQATQLCRLIRRKIEPLKLHYGGTCAQYLTKRNLSCFLNIQGFQVKDPVGSGLAIDSTPI